MNIYTMRGEDVAILDTLRGVQKRYGEKYCFPSQKTILRLLREFHKVVMCPRSLNYHLKDLSDKGFIYRIRRHTKGKFMSTAYYLCDKVGGAIGQLSKIFGMAKRLRSFYPNRMQNLAHNRITSQSGDMQQPNKEVAAGLPNSPQHLFKRGEAFLRSLGIKKPAAAN